MLIFVRLGSSSGHASPCGGHPFHLRVQHEVQVLQLSQLQEHRLHQNALTYLLFPMLAHLHQVEKSASHQYSHQVYEHRPGQAHVPRQRKRKYHLLFVLQQQHGELMSFFLTILGHKFQQCALLESRQSQDQYQGQVSRWKWLARQLQILVAQASLLSLYQRPFQFARWLPQEPCSYHHFSF